MLCLKNNCYKSYNETEEKKNKKKINVEQLVKEHKDDLRKFIYRHLWYKEDVDDVLQSTFLEVIKCANQFRGESTAKTWLFGIAYNLIKSQGRKAIPCYEAIELIESELFCNENKGYGIEDPFTAIERKEILNLVLENKELLSSELGQTLMLVIMKENSYSQVAKELSIPLGTVQSRVSRAREIIRSKFL